MILKTEEEFIDRTKKMVGVTHYAKLSSEKMHACKTKYKLKLFCPTKGFFAQDYLNVNKTAILHCSADTSFLHIIAADTEEELSQISFYSCRPCYYLTGSLDAHLFAALHDVCVSNARGDHIYSVRYDKMLTIIDTLHGKKESFMIREDFSIPSFYFYSHKFPSVIAFNKQKTRVIVHGRDQKQHPGIAYHLGENGTTDYCIMPLTCTAQKESQNKKTLQHYFAHKGICKQLK